MSNDVTTEKQSAELSLDNSANGVWVKSKHKQVLDVLKGLTVAQARFVLDIVIDDIAANAVVSN